MVERMPVRVPLNDPKGHKMNVLCIQQIKMLSVGRVKAEMKYFLETVKMQNHRHLLKLIFYFPEFLSIPFRARPWAGLIKD